MFDEIQSEHGTEALVQCWHCEKVNNRKVGLVGRPEEVRCFECGGEVEILRTMDAAGVVREYGNTQ